MDRHISFVVTARNDDYGGNFLHRMQVFLNALSELCSRQESRWELIIVEWNPPPDKPGLAEVIKWPSSIDSDTMRIIQVPSEIHYRLPNSARMPMFEYIAKNVGIRRARGRFVLATNPDIIFSAELIKYLFSDKLRDDWFYRVNRYDVEKEIPLNMTVEEQLILCRRYSTKVALRLGTVNTNHDMLKLMRLHAASVIRALTSKSSGSVVRDRFRLHTNASGDFFLMAKAKWDELRGYPEFKSHSFIDGYICAMAASLGLKQAVPSGKKRIYHQEHDRSEHSRRPLTDLDALYERGAIMLRSRTPIIFNGEDWGLAGDQLSVNIVEPVLDSRQ